MRAAGTGPVRVAASCSPLILYEHRLCTSPEAPAACVRASGYPRTRWTETPRFRGGVTGSSRTASPPPSTPYPTCPASASRRHVLNACSMTGTLCGQWTKLWPVWDARRGRRWGSRCLPCSDPPPIGPPRFPSTTAPSQSATLPVQSRPTSSSAPRAAQMTALSGEWAHALAAPGRALPPRPFLAAPTALPFYERASPRERNFPNESLSVSVQHA